VTVQTVPSGIVLNITNTPLQLRVRPATLSAVTSSMVVSPAPELAASGSSARVTLTLLDVFGNARPDADGAALLITGGVTRVTSLYPSNLTVTTTPGVYTYSHTFAAIQNVSFALYAHGILAGAQYALPAAGATAAAVNFTSSLASATVFVDGYDPFLPRPPLIAAGQLAAEAWHVVHLPILRTALAWAGRYVADPLLTVTLRVTPLSVNGSREENRTRAFAGFWSWSAGDYSVPFKLPLAEVKRINGSFATTLTLAHLSGAQVRGARGWLLVGRGRVETSCCSSSATNLHSSTLFPPFLTSTATTTTTRRPP